VAQDLSEGRLSLQVEGLQRGALRASKYRQDGTFADAADAAPKAPAAGKAAAPD